MRSIPFVVDWVEVCCVYKVLTYLVKLPFFIRFLKTNNAPNTKSHTTTLDGRREAAFIWFLILLDFVMMYLYMNNYFEFAYCHFLTNRTDGTGGALEFQTLSSSKTLPQVSDPSKFEEYLYCLGKNETPKGQNDSAVDQQELKNG